MKEHIEFTIIKTLRIQKLNLKAFFYLQQLKVLFEDRYFHWNTGPALYELVNENELINWKETVFVGPEKQKRTISLFQRKGERYYKKNTKIILDNNKIFDNDFNKAIGEWGEHLTEFMFLKNKFQIIDKHTNKFRNRMWTKTKHNLDLIVVKDDITYGVEVKNRFEYISETEFKIKIEMCKYLGLKPLCVLRMAPKPFFNELINEGGYGFIFKSKILPIGFGRLATAFWENTLLPIASKKELSEKGERLFLEWHNKNI